LVFLYSLGDASSDKRCEQFYSQHDAKSAARLRSAGEMAATGRLPDAFYARSAARWFILVPSWVDELATFAVQAMQENIERCT
jgi:hypothetical protein